MVQGPETSATAGSLLDVWNLKPHPRPTKEKSVFLRFPSDSYTYYSLRSLETGIVVLIGALELKDPKIQFSSCVTLGKLLNLSEYQVSHV